MSAIPFRNRTEAGRTLSHHLLAQIKGASLMVIALPGGGMTVAYEVAKALHAPLDVFLTNSSIARTGRPGTVRTDPPSTSPMNMKIQELEVQIPSGQITLDGTLTIPEQPVGIVIFAHGSGSSRHSPRNRYVAKTLQQAHLSTLLMDLLTSAEEVVDIQTAHLRFNISLLADRLVHATDWVSRHRETRELRIGYFGSSTGAAAALMAAAERPTVVQAVVSRGGRPDLAALALPYVQAPTLLIVGGNDIPVIGMNKQAMLQMRGETRLEIIPGASHLFEEHGALEKVAQLASHWFQDRLPHHAGRVS